MPMPVNAAVLTKPGQSLELRPVLLDDPLETEVTVRTVAAGLCHSDLHYLDGSLDMDLPAILGHEVFGIVERIGDAVTRLKIGDRVVATVTPACGVCNQCLAGRPTQCRRVDEMRARSRPKFTTTDGEPIGALGGIGAFAEAFVTGESSLALVDDAVPANVACLLGCCITTGVGAAVHGAHIGAEDTVVVIGCGGVGIAAVQGARLAGARKIVAVDALSPKLDLARRFGATHTVLAQADQEETLALLREIEPDGFTNTIEAVGRTTTAELAFDALAPSGTATILGLMTGGSRINISADALVYGDRRIQGAYMGANRFLSDVEMFTDHYAAGRLDLDGMVTRTIPFTWINEGFAAMSDPTTIRVVVEFEGENA
ncbi:alcohol dehydrogenase catalytic domain-containing protein [Streptomyces sp. SID8361]|uniref:alcohol dehydrogenase catalytic domain-containing protein n=1 Tax=Streptomyces sp. MnatMP-M27 TaxID=1839768 RepID=UPI00081ECB79|nr:alcohol dehydrogenase catalytic domain-containing protein [Streptomyces sp. MnatMP-M27]MYU11084.1 alcohol dehydrogenase catalytic domain-containing protein [Streptomyces sp. SID8361]SCF78147.1 alcohol dehydrogenase/S-(hydroxymethyl)glutathione dehydrogenase / alcohol dehydrogenase [Streptomyces sp. MnatMP-M27]